MKAKTQLIDASAALYYEVLVLEATAKALSSQTVDDPLQARAVIESFLIHSRNLIDFMYPTKPEKDDILAQDFFLDPGDWLRQREAEGAILQTSKRRINKLLSHLTYTRLKTSSEDSKWDSVGRYCQMLWMRFWAAASFTSLGDQKRSRFAEDFDLFIHPASEARLAERLVPRGRTRLASHLASVGG